MAVGLIDRMAVYQKASGGGFDTLIKSDVSCRLVHVRGTGAGVEERAELARLRRLLYDAGYTLLNYAQVEIMSERWNPVPGTDAAPRGPTGVVHHHSVDVVRAR